MKERITVISSKIINDHSKIANICNDIWFHISEYIIPEEVGKFALICQDTAALVKSKRFWGILYKKYCKKLPPYLHIGNIKTCEVNFLRCRMIEFLFICYEPLVNRLKEGYSLDFLKGRYYLSSWYMETHCLWTICYKFSNTQTNIIKEPSEDVEESWESLDSKYFESKRYIHPHEGISLLVILCNHFTPFPTQLLYSGSHNQIRLTATRKKLTSDMRLSNLELDFQDGTSKNNITVIYPKILKFKIYPWWHSEFKIFNK